LDNDEGHSLWPPPSDRLRGVSWRLLVNIVPGEQRPNADDGHPEDSEINKELYRSTGAKIKEEERQAELRRQEWSARQEQWRQEEDRRRVAESIEESREELAKAIGGWAKAVSLEQFFSGVQSRAQDLPEEQRLEVLERLALAREFVGTQDPLQSFRSWKTPVEKYLPLSMQKAAAKQD
jgi:hypothetical protein